MKALCVLILSMGFIGTAYAGCTGAGSYKTCTDANGNTYTVQRIGSSTYVQGTNSQTGNYWSQSTTRVGNSSYTNGYDAKGNAWTQNTQTIGSTTYQSGYDSDGNAYRGTVQRSGGTTTYSGTDSDGNYYRKTCTSYGCY